MINDCFDRQKEFLRDPEWFEAENTGDKHYYWLEMYGGGRCIKLYTQATAELISKRTGLKTEKMRE